MGRKGLWVPRDSTKATKLLWWATLFGAWGSLFLFGLIGALGLIARFTNDMHGLFGLNAIIYLLIIFGIVGIINLICNLACEQMLEIRYLESRRIYKY